ncbi:SPOR domain-containing protein [Paenibacillus tarimensis]|uniref:SPOR domain-containing protein n=1 Tax=Paenibacillus tarimensis TaxID=416012 RepID=UPI001F3420C0|nr:SPOR domain-containing protein [Paenibacillus tarimensis]MCF2943945.1 SPOR domain-containing protein [Paenibacillus tarimensis]
MKPKARITYRFDHKAQVNGGPSAENRVPPVSGSNVISLYPEELKFTTDVEAWKSPFQDDPAALEKLIRESGGREDDDSSEEQRDDSIVSVSGKEIENISDIERYEAQPAVEAERKPVQLIPLGDEHRSGQDRYESDGKPAGDRGADNKRSGKNRVINSPAVPEVNPAPVLSESSVDELDEPEDKRYRGYVVHRQQPGGPSWLKVFGSVGGALATGALFGYLLLSLFAGNSVLPGSQGAGKVAEKSGAVNEPAPTQVASNQTSAPTAAEIPAETYYMLQYGVFSQAEGMEAAMAELKSRGYSAAALQADDFRVYAGMAATKAEAEALAKQLSGLEVYVKAVDIPEVSGFPHEGGGQDAEQFFTQTAELANHLAGLTVTILEGGSVSVKEWLDSYNAWAASFEAFRKGVNAEGAEELSHIALAYETAANSIAAYQSKESRSYIWQAQSALMSAVFAQKEWFGQF